MLILKICGENEVFILSTTAKPDKNTLTNERMATCPKHSKARRAKKLSLKISSACAPLGLLN